MNDEEHSCLLRRLTLCAATGVVTTDPRRLDRCYCAVQAAARSHGDEEAAREALYARARAVARADRLERTRTLRQNLARWSEF